MIPMRMEFSLTATIVRNALIQINRTWMGTVAAMSAIRARGRRMIAHALPQVAPMEMETESKMRMIIAQPLLMMIS